MTFSHRRERLCLPGLFRYLRNRKYKSHSPSTHADSRWNSITSIERRPAAIHKPARPIRVNAAHKIAQPAPRSEPIAPVHCGFHLAFAYGRTPHFAQIPPARYRTSRARMMSAANVAAKQNAVTEHISTTPRDLVARIQHHPNDLAAALSAPHTIEESVIAPPINRHANQRAISPYIEGPNKGTATMRP